MKINGFEELDCWKEARGLVNLIYDLTSRYNFSRDFKLKEQIQSAAVSGMSNIAEGFDRKSNKDFMRFLRIAFSSVTEVQSQLYVALDRKYIDKNGFQESYKQAVKVKNIIGGFCRYLEKTLNVERRTLNDKGFLLIDVLVAVATYTLFVAFASVFFVGFSRQYQNTMRISQELEKVSNVFEEILATKQAPDGHEQLEISAYSEGITRVVYRIDEKRGVAVYF
jgi:four helix bundle protein